MVPLIPLGLLRELVDGGAIQLLICVGGALSSACNAVAGTHGARASRLYRAGWDYQGDVELELAHLWMRRGLVVPAIAAALQLAHAIRRALR